MTVRYHHNTYRTTSGITRGAPQSLPTLLLALRPTGHHCDTSAAAAHLEPASACCSFYTPRIEPAALNVFSLHVLHVLNTRDPQSECERLLSWVSGIHRC